MLVKVLNTGILQVNTYVLIDLETKEAVVIDLGGDLEKVLDYIKKENADLKYILNTHGHFDHIMGDLQVKHGNLNIPIYMHKDDLDFATNIGTALKRWGIEYPAEPIEIDLFVDENTDLKIGDKKIKVIHTPGHSRGGVCYLVENHLFSGDTLFYQDIGRTDLEGGDYDTLISSIKNKLLPLPDETNVYPGHGPSSTIGNERINNPYLK